MAPVVLIEENMEDRARRIFNEYVVQALDVKEKYQTYLLKIEKYLGGAFRQELSVELRDLYSGEVTTQKFMPWIQKILERYYDKKYDHAFAKQNRKILFRGNFKEVFEFFQLNPNLVF